MGRWINAADCNLRHTHTQFVLSPVFFFILQRTHRLPKEMTPIEPSDFAAQLISRLEKLKREQDTMSSLEERLQQIQEVRMHANLFSTASRLETHNLYPSSILHRK